MQASRDLPNKVVHTINTSNLFKPDYCNDQQLFFAVSNVVILGHLPGFLKQRFSTQPPNAMAAVRYAQEAFEHNYKCHRPTEPVLRANTVCPAFAVFKQTFCSPAQDLLGRSHADRMKQLSVFVSNKLRPVVGKEEVRRSLWTKILDILGEVSIPHHDFSDLMREKLLSYENEVRGIDIARQTQIQKRVYAAKDGGSLQYVTQYIELKNEAGTSGDVVLSQLLSYVRNEVFLSAPTAENSSGRKNKASTKLPASGNQKVDSADFPSYEQVQQNQSPKPPSPDDTTVERTMSSLYQAATRAGDLCPSLGIISYGNHIEVHAIWLEQGEICSEQLVGVQIWLLTDDDDDGVSDLQRFLFALYDCTPFLDKHYASLDSYLRANMGNPSLGIGYINSTCFYTPFRAAGRRCLGDYIDTDRDLSNWCLQVTGLIDERKYASKAGKILFGTMAMIHNELPQVDQLNLDAKMPPSFAVESKKLPGEPSTLSVNMTQQEKTMWRVLYAVDRLESDVKVMVKCLRRKRYPHSLHEQAGRSKLVPKLLLAVQMPGNIIIVVMEHLDSKEAWKVLADLKFNERAIWRSAVESVYENFVSLQQSAGKVMVHGDLRPANIMVRTTSDGTKEVRLLDLDWAGEEGEAIYPSHINLELFRQVLEDIKACTLIQSEHDQKMLAACFDEGFEI